MNPPRPRCAFRVAVTGHRWDRLPAGNAPDLLVALRGIFDKIGESIRIVSALPDSGFAADLPQLVLLSGLAEGADRLAAEAARAGAWQLHAVLPFAAENYRTDFTSTDSPPGSAAAFDALLEGADRITVLDGIPGRFDAYAPLAHTLVAQCDLVIAIWDGAPGRGPGGTVEVVGLARREDIPIVRIDLSGRTVWLEDLAQADEGREVGLTSLHHRLQQLIAPPMIPKGEGDPRKDYFKEVLPRRAPSAWYQAMVALAWRPDGSSASALVRSMRAFTRKAPGAFTDDVATRGSREWTERWAELNAPARADAIQRFAAHHAWADALATWYAAEFRGAFARVFALAWLAVGGAYLSATVELISTSEGGHLAVALGRTLEVGVLVYIVATVRIVRKRRLHDRWLDYRSLAERIRHLSFLWPVGRTTDLIRVTPAPILGDPRLSWVGWHLRAIAREAGLIPGSWDAAHRKSARTLLRNGELTRQQEFHEATVKRTLHVSERFDHLAEGLFWAALGLATLELGTLVTAVRVPHALAAAFGGLAVAMPALAASIHGFLGTADLEGAAIRSARLSPRLAELIGRLDRAPEAEMTELGEVAEAAARLMETDLSTWQQVTASRRLQAV